MKKTACSSISLFLGCLLAVSALASCGGGDTTAVDTSANTASAETTAPAETETTRLMPDLPEADYGGYVFRVSHW